jgi:hypothetical protein
MNQKWGREDDAGDFPSDRAVWTIGAFCVALLSVFAVAGYRYMRVWTPLQRHYLLTYAGTPVAGALRTDASYTLLMVLTRTLGSLDVVAKMSVHVGAFCFKEDSRSVHDCRIQIGRSLQTFEAAHSLVHPVIEQEYCLVQMCLLHLSFLH